MLTPRQRQILYLIVRLYSEFEEPVGSKTLLRESLLNVSPATIRNDMVVLEREGLLHKAHTSSGRIPSFSGYRYYVNRLIHHEDEMRVLEEDDNAIAELFHERQVDDLQLAQMAADVLVSLTGYTAVVLGQSNDSHHLKEFKLVYLNEKNLIAIMITDGGRVETQLFVTQYPVTKDIISKTSEIVNQELVGTSIEDVYHRLKLTIPLLTQRAVSYSFDFSPLAEKTLHSLKGRQYHTSGKNNLFDFIDSLTNSEELKDLFTLVDGSASMYQMLENRQAGIEVLFGVDMSPDWVTNLSLVTGKFKRQKQEFTLGLIGPTTMPYHRIIGLMEKMITELTNY
ncbi:heat-inducible transcription repressor HrcA [Aerococcaceae bacterium DSM 109653]|uniref:Heat-inducible transcription repressor HrcA n=1 Tax=Fundicoccus ignavus TaxID=2664442 RepID=A0A844BXM1_9LACT|nr:heat-inducible transcriptional repressor HrcA [Fundicoccus ignavus]MRI82653.1 heat-inducible transcription repressor HrcA [Fundicoccus ignavus]